MQLTSLLFRAVRVYAEDNKTYVVVLYRQIRSKPQLKLRLRPRELAANVRGIRRQTTAASRPVCGRKECVLSQQTLGSDLKKRSLAYSSLKHSAALQEDFANLLSEAV